MQETPDDKANARLIAAVPRMFAALQAARDVLAEYVDVRDGDDGRPVANDAMSLGIEIEELILEIEGKA